MVSNSAAPLEKPAVFTAAIQPVEQPAVSTWMRINPTDATDAKQRMIFFVSCSAVLVLMLIVVLFLAHWARADRQVRLDRRLALMRASHPLVGTWAWEAGADYLYVFNSDGSGTRGAASFLIESFTWSPEADGHLVLVIGGRRGNWDYLIRDDALFLTSRDIPGWTFRYIRSR